MDPLDTSLRMLRIVHVALLATIPFYAYAAEMVSRNAPEGAGPTAQGVLVALGVSTVASALFIRRSMVQANEEKLRTRPDDAQAIGQWRAGNIASFVISEAVALYGFVLRALGGTFKMALAFYAAALLLLLIFTPRRP